MTDERDTDPAPPILRIENHRLVADPGHPFEIVDRCDEVMERVNDKRADRGLPPMPTIRTSLLLVHYAVTDSLDATYAAQKARDYWAHLSIDGYREGQRSRFRLIQQVPFNIQASHAGPSTWKGQGGCNGYSIGVEIANPGPLVEDGGLLRTVYGKAWDPTDAVKLPVPKGYPKQWTHWAKYSPEEMSILASVGLCLRDAGLIADVAGHSDVSPGRKFDPGPACNLEWLRSTLFGAPTT